MTNKQKQAAIKLLESDCQITDRYLLRGKTCALGCLAIAAGVPRRMLMRENSKQGIENLPAVAAKITAKFGLTLKQQALIQSENDYETDVVSRRESVIGALQSMECERRIK